MKYLLAVLMSSLIAFGATAQAGDDEKTGRYGKQKVVYHVNFDDPVTQTAALRNIQNHVNAVGAENLDLKVVMHGAGVSMVLMPDMAKNTKFAAGNANEEMQATITGLKGQGINFNICANTLKGKKVDYHNDLYDVKDADIVPSGVAELAHLQGQGYTYIKP